MAKSLQDIMSEEGAMSPTRAFELMQPICAGHRRRAPAKRSCIAI